MRRYTAVFAALFLVAQWPQPTWAQIRLIGAIRSPLSSPAASAATDAAFAAAPALAAAPPLAEAPAPALNAPANPTPEPIGEKETAAKPYRPRQPSYDYGRMFDLTRRVLSRPEARKFIKEIFEEELAVSDEDQRKYELPEKIKEISESQFMLLLQYYPKHWTLIEKYLTAVPAAAESEASEKKRAKWRAAFRELVKKDEIGEAFKNLNDPVNPLHLKLAGDAPAYGGAKLYANQQTVLDGQVSPPADLKRVLIDFIGSAEKQLMFNVFDFGLPDVADAMIAAAERGVKIIGGIDKGNVDARPEVKAVFDRLSGRKNITIVAVDSVGLNHQKIVLRDWSDEKLAASLFSSGNFTQSCIGPEGDLKDIQPTPAVSLPNANHMVILEGYLPAQIAANNLIKTLEFGLRGDAYPLGGAFKVTGPKAADAKQAPQLVIAFSPKGGLGDINRDILRRLIVGTRGVIRMLQFAFSSQTVLEALIERARLEIKDGNAFDFKSVGDTPFSLRPWAVFLAMAGKAFLEETKTYIDLKDNPLKDAMGAAAYEEMLKNIRVAPREYGNNRFTYPDGSSREVNAKLHHKSLISGPFTVFGTSFNFSENAEHNNEQILLTDDPAIRAAMLAVFDGFFLLSTRTVVEEAERRNRRIQEGQAEEERDDGESRHVEKESARAGKKGS